MPKEKYVASIVPLRLDAQQNFIGGLLASTAEEKIRRYREATRLDPAYARAWMELGKTYYNQHAYEPAISASARFPFRHRRPRGQFLSRSRRLRSRRLRKIRNRLRVRSRALALAEVYNNLGVVAARRSQKQAADDFERAIQNDPSDADYHFNLAVTLNQAGDRPPRPANCTPPSIAALATSKPKCSSTRSRQPSAAVSSQPAPRLRKSRRAHQAQLRGRRFPPDDRANRKLGRTAFCALRSPRPCALSRRTRQGTPGHGFTTEAEAEFRHAAAVDPNNSEAQNLKRTLATQLARKRSPSHEPIKVIRPPKQFWIHHTPAFWRAPSLAASCSADVLRISINDAIQPVTAEFIGRALDTAAANHDQAVLIEINTPGGLVDSTRDIIEKIVASPVPVILYVTPAAAAPPPPDSSSSNPPTSPPWLPAQHGAAHPVILGERWTTS